MKPSILLKVLVLGTLASVSVARAQLSMTWFTIDGGGESSRQKELRGGLRFHCSVGQPDAQVHRSTGRTLAIPAAADPTETVQTDPMSWAGLDAGLAAAEQPTPSYALYGGYLPGAFPQTLPYRLEIRRDGSSTLILSWPTAAVGFGVFGATNLTGNPEADWSLVTGEVVVVGDRYEMSVRNSGQARYFLIYPAYN